MIESLYKRRPEVADICANQGVSSAGLAMAIKKGYCGSKIERIEIHGSCLMQGREVIDEGLSSFIATLRDGSCPKLKSLVFKARNKPHLVVMAMGEALGSRMTMGGSGLKSLVFQNPGHWHCEDVPDLSPLLSSGACEELEVMDLEGCGLSQEANASLAQWVARTRAPYLRHLIIDVSYDVMMALCTPGVAPCLEVMDLRPLRGVFGGGYSKDRGVHPHLSYAIKRRQWPHLR